MNSRRIDVVVSPASIRYIQSPLAAEVFQDLPHKEVRRVSHVEPCNWPLRLLFHLLRWYFGDYGLVASWTRYWPCLWRVNLEPTGGDIHYVDCGGKPFLTRARAIEFELPFAVKALTERS